MEGVPADMLRRTSNVRLTIFLHGNSVQTRSRRSTRSDGMSPLKREPARTVSYSAPD